VRHCSGLLLVNLVVLLVISGTGFNLSLAWATGFFLIRGVTGAKAEASTITAAT
jgi:hypothetical protein